MTASREKSLVAGDVVDGKLEIVRVLGEGGMGAVYEARNLRTDRAVAVKVLHHGLIEDADLVQRVLAEARAGGRVQHPNVVDVYDAGVHEGAPYLVMELLRGESLGRRLHREKVLPVGEAVRIVVDAAAGLAAAHALGIVHRDLKPENVFLAQSATGETVVKVVDFGISKQTGATDVSTTRTGTVVGTPVYMAPEQARGLRDLDARVDIYGLAAVLFELLTGRPPFVADNYNALLAALLTETAPLVRTLRPEVPEALESVVARALSRDRDARFATIAEFSAALSTSVGGEAGLAATAFHPVGSLPSPASPTPSPSSPSTPPTPHSSGAFSGTRAFAAIAVLIAIGLLAWRPWAHDTTSSRATPMMALPPIDPRRVAIVPTEDPGTIVDGRLSWALASRLVEELDRYEEFRPASPAGLLAARMTELGDPLRVPDEVQAAHIATDLRAGTIVSLATHTIDGGVRVATHVYDGRDLSSGRSVPAVELTMASLDADGPARLAERVAEALRQHFRVASLTSSMAAADDRTTSFAAFETYLDAEHALLDGDYDHAAGVARRAIAMDSEQPLFYAALACALSYSDVTGSDVELRAAVDRAKALRGRVQQRHTQVLIDHDILWGETELAMRGGDRARVVANTRQILAYDVELATQYGDPTGYLYAGAAEQYFAGDRDGARRYYATARERSPSLYPAYAEEARLMRGDGSWPEGNDAAARLLFTYIECNPHGTRLDDARRQLHAWHLARPRGQLKCPGG